MKNLTTTQVGDLVHGDKVGRDKHEHHHHHAFRKDVRWPHQLGVVPPLADRMQPRPTLTAALDVAVAARETPVLTQVLSGMGGVGKTQLAAAYARRQWSAQEVDLLVWITATSRESVLVGYVQAVTDLLDPPPSPGDDPEHTAARFLAWLVTTDKRWLIVLDDLADPADLRRLWPDGPTGRTLVTSRRQDSVLTGQGRRPVDVGLSRGFHADVVSIN